MEDQNQGARPYGPPAGMYDGKLDDRGRLKLPSDWANFFRGIAETVLFVTSVDGRMAQIYPMSVWRENEKLMDASEDPETAQKVAFAANANGMTVEMDAQNRITFPPKLRELLRMDGQGLHLYGYRGHIEVLTDEVYGQEKQVDAATLQAAALKMKKAGLR